MTIFKRKKLRRNTKTIQVFWVFGVSFDRIHDRKSKNQGLHSSILISEGNILCFRIFCYAPNLSEGIFYLQYSVLWNLVCCRHHLKRMSYALEILVLQKSSYHFYH